LANNSSEATDFQCRSDGWRSVALSLS